MSKIRVEFLYASSAQSFRPKSNLFETGFDLQSESREMYRNWCRLYLCQTVRKHFARHHLAEHGCRKNAVNSMCLVLRVDPLRLIITSASKESHHRICYVVSLVSSALHPNLNNQFHCGRKLVPSQAPESAATNSASPLLSAIVDCFLLDAVIGYQSLPRNHDALPLTLNRSTSPAQSESPYVNTGPTRALFAASRLSVVGRTVMISRCPRRYRSIDFDVSHVRVARTSQA